MKRLRLLLLFFVLLALAPTTVLAATVGATTLADPSSASTWRKWGLENSTENVGRIWTDKTVSAGDIVLTGAGGEKVIPKEKDSDFLTAFSAISSTSNLRETATTPLDIVLVLDASGSMDDPMGNNDSTKRIDALKAAANSFIDEIAARNAGISKADQRHSVAVVKFSGNKTDLVGNRTYRDGGHTYNYSQAMQNLTVVDANGASNLKAKVNAISPAGATRSDYGLELAQSQLEHGRAGARKVVVFFTDGKPTSYSEFDDGVASSAIATAKAIKDAGGTVYTIGIFSGANATADPTNNRTSSENKFMQAVSSNYPNATYAYSWGVYSWNLGTRVKGAAFYKTATNADELKAIFNDISKEISDAAGYPTDVTDGLEHASGYVTFTDQLGDYMKVDDFNHIVFANQVFDAHTKTTSGNVDTYLFEGSVPSTIYPNGNLNTIIIQVRRAAKNDLRTGDHVTVKIPAALIPLRAFEVNADNNTGSVSLTFPIRVFFGSSLKDGVTELLANPDAQMTDYIAGHTDTDGKVYFLANTWSSDKPDGNATASFTPAKENSYYYITRDTPIYEDKALTQPAAYPLVKGKTYYYERTFWNISGTSASQDSHIVSFDSSVVENIDGYISDTGDGHAQFSQGTPRMTYINELHNNKSSNATKTATSFINPKWSGSQVFVWLGNNGKLSLPEPGSLEVSKTIVVPEGFDAADYADQDFDFTVSIPEAKGKTVTGTVTDASGQAQGDKNFSITFGANGTYTHKLKGGQKLTITGLSSGWKYEVTEASLSGWTASSEGASGTIAAGEKSVAAFSNTYGATGTLSGSTSLSGEKTLIGRDWTAQDKFCFVLTGIDGAPMPEGSENDKFALQLSQSEGTPEGQGVDFNFGDITYTKPGTYVYNIVEARAGDGYDVTILPGVSVSQALYRVTITVTDKNHDGTLVVTSTMLQLKDDSGATLADGTGEEANCASFTNVFDVDEAEWDLRGTKHYEDKTGSRPLSSGMFQFELEPVTKGAPMPANTDATTGKARASVDATGRFAFEQVTFGKSHVNPDGTSKPYEYKLYEVNGGAAGVTYDTTVWHITVTVSLQDGDVVLDVQNTRKGQEAKPGETVSFSNSYKAESAVVNGFIHGTKTLMGRDSLDGEKFAFSLTQASGPEGGCTGFSPEVEVGDLADSEAKSFNFGASTFTKAGTYVFKVREVAPDQPAGGLTYDDRTYTVTVKVADEGGKLVVQSTTYSDEAARDVKAATFINTYRPADADYAGITVSKTLIGRTMLEGEFNFTIEGEDEQSDALLASSDRAFANDGQRASGEKNAMTKLSGLHFDRSDVGTYRFKVAEVIPADPADKLPGVKYDQKVYHVKISVADALNGTLAVTTTIDDQPGTEVAFVNSYEAAPGSFATASFGLTKALEGRDWDSSDAFTFELTGIDGAPMPAGAVDGKATANVDATDVSDGRVSFDFGQISYAATGVYDYEVREVNAGQTLRGVTYSTNVARFRVTVTDSVEQGKLVATARLTSGSARFVNTYLAELDYNALGGLSVTKTLEGTSAAAGKFSFTVKPDGDDILGIAGTYASGKLTNGGTVTVAATSGEIVFTQNDAGKTWNYTVTEAPLGEGYTCECSTWNVSVSVANDVKNGSLLVTTTVSDDKGTHTRSWTYASDGKPAEPGATVAFVNRYSATGSTADIVGTKTLNGRLMSAREFEFQLVDEAGDVVATARNDESGSVNFGSLSYTAPGTYTYTAREVTDGLAEGVTPVSSRFTVTVDVTDKAHNGTLNCDVKYPKGGLAFVNSYGTGDAEIEVSGTKVLEGRDLRDSEFDFTITGEAGAPMPERTKVTNANGGFSFGKIRFTLDNVFGGVVIQDADGEAGQSGEVPSDEEPVADSESEAGPRVGAPSSETDEKDAELGPAAPETEPVSDPSDSPAPAEEPQQDELLAQDEVADLDTPVVEEVSAPDAEAASTPDATDAATVNAAHWQTFRRNLFHIASEAVEPLAGTSRQRTFHYVVTEETRSAAGVTNDRRSTRDIYITVTDDGHGQLTAEFTNANGAPLTTGQPDLTFTNVYKPAPTFSRVTDQVTITKVLTGRSMVAGEFCFKMLEDGKEVATGTNAADGTVALSPITYDAPGTHSYEIREVNGGKTIDGVRYSGTTYHVNTTVSDTGNGAFAVKHELVEEGPATFTNAYETTPADVTITAHKELLGATLTDGQFAFQLTGMGSDLRATNDAKGNVAFPHLLLTEPGTYTYELRELNDGQEGVTYDERVYVVTVTVTDDGLGHLSAEVSMDAADGALTFTNTYTPPVTPEEPPAPKPPTKPDPTPAPKPARPSRPLSKTGDVTSDAIVATLVAVAVTLLAGTLAMRRRR